MSASTELATPLASIRRGETCMQGFPFRSVKDTTTVLPPISESVRSAKEFRRKTRLRCGAWQPYHQ
jgi:hypothetical protein